MIATFIIFMREGIEASMIAAILAAYLTKIGQRHAIRYVLAGMGSAVILAGILGAGIYAAVHNWADTRAQTIFESFTYLLAAGLLIYMALWMGRHARSLSSELRSQADGALSSGERRCFFLIAFQATLREGIEAAVFTLAIVFGPAGKGALIGAAVGLLVAAVVAFAIFKLGKAINVKLFFSVIGQILIVFGAGLFADAISGFQDLGWLSFLDQPMWNSSGAIADSSTLGDLLHSFLGYSASPTPLQLLGWVAYLGTAFVVLHRQRIRLSAPAVAKG